MDNLQHFRRTDYCGTFTAANVGQEISVCGWVQRQRNLGSLIQCRNSGSVNTTEVETEKDLTNVDWEQLNSAENMPASTDIGGIAGWSSGILQSCSNSGPVGYAHVGYNIGGVVGRQSGYLDGCSNSGPILGRKDVGGVAGQHSQIVDATLC